MEYAMYGSLKDYLRSCREEVLSSEGSLKITNLRNTDWKREESEGG